MMIEEARSDVVCVTVLCCSYVIVMKWYREAKLPIVLQWQKCL